jgi:hypothetical protein
MMRISKVYIETTMFNYYFDIEREAHPYTVRFFEEIKAGHYDPYTSRYVINELELAPEPKKTMMLKLINEYSIKIIEAQDAAIQLAQVYIAEGVIPGKYQMDSLHIAITAVMNLDFIVSLNFAHIVKRKTIEMTELINFREGYKRVGIYSPMEVVTHEKDS